MRGLVVAELAVLAGIWVAFLGVYVTGRWRSTAVGRQLLAMAAVSLAEVLGLLGAALDHGPPLWVFAVVYGAADAVMAGWLLLLWRARRRGRESEGS